MSRYGLVIDVTRCNGCYNCFLACRDEFCGNDFPEYSASQPMKGHFWMKLLEKERGTYPNVKVAYVAIPCMHCDDAMCTRVAKDGAIYKRKDGIVIIDPEKSFGQRSLLSACPYNVIYWNEEKQLPQKCTLCAHLLDKGWKEPRCVEACPTGALVFGDLDDPSSAIAQLIASDKTELLNPDYGMGEKVRYIGLPKRFIAGSVVFGDKDECAEGVNVTLNGKGISKSIKTDNYGDFEFEGLPANEEYSIKIEAQSYTSQIFQVKTNLDICLGDIIIVK